MVFTDHQVRQFYVVDSTHTATPVVSNHKFYVKYIDPSNTTITTDKIDSGCIRDIRITKQPGWTPQVWVITPNTSNSSVSNVYMLHMLFRNVFGGGVNDFYVKDIPVVIPANETPANVLSKIKEAIELNLSRDFVNPFTVTKTSTSIILTEKAPNYNMIRGIHRLPLDVKINVDEANMTGTNSAPVMSNWGTVSKLIVSDLTTYDGTSSSGGSYDYAIGDFMKYSTKVYQFKEAYDKTVHDADDLTSKIDEVATITSLLPTANGPEVCDMEYFFSKGRADLYGYMGFPDVNPSEMVASAASDYYILDIKYFYQEAGVNNQNSEKELSFACTDKNKLETIITNIVNSTSGTSISGVNGCEIYTPVAY